MRAVIVYPDHLRMIVARLRCLHDTLRDMASDMDTSEPEWAQVAEDWRKDAEAVRVAADILENMVETARAASVPGMVM